MRPEKRYEWLIEYISGKRGGVDILDAEFVESYIEATKAKYQIPPYGAYRCNQLQRDLKHMYDNSILQRDRIGIPYDMRGMGFPLWVWNYRVYRF